MPDGPGLSQEQGLHHRLTAGQMAMVAVGGSIGTGLLLGSANAISLAGPSVILSFLLAGFINFTVACALGELACAHPAAGSFGVYGDLYLNDWAGFLSRGGYWATIAAFVVLGSGLLLSGRVTPQYTAQGGFFPLGLLAPLLAMTFAVYAFGGIEFVAVSSGEARSPREIANAVRITFAMLAVLYIGAIAVLVGVMPWNRAAESESPFVTVFRLANIPAAGHLMNFVVLTAALSGANAALYVSSRMLFSMARTGWAPARLGRLNQQGSPKLAVIVSSYGILVALALERWAPGNAFEFILRGAFFGMILSWVVSLAAHFSFRRRASPEQLRALPLRSPLGAWGSGLGFGVICAVILKGWWDSRVNLISGLLYLLLLTAAWAVIRRTRHPQS